MISKTLFILNPISGTLFTKALKKIMINHTQGAKLIDVAYTEYGGHAAKIIEEHFDEYDGFVAVGGDGTVNEVASALINTNKYFAVYPTGSGNGFARELGFKPRIKSLVKTIESGQTRSIDTININGKTCINMAGIGFDAYVAHLFSKAKRRGLLSYAAISIGALFTYKPQKIKIQINNKIIEEQIFMLSIANTRQFGNNALIAPQADHSDGLIDLVIAKPFPKILLIPFGIRMFMGTLKTSKYISFVKASEAIIELKGSTQGHIDGEAVSFTNPIQITLTPSNLNVVSK